MATGSQGSLGLIATELANVLAPLERMLASGNTTSFFAAAGIPLTAAQSAALAAPIAASVAGSVALVQLAADLNAAPDNSAAVLAKSLATAAKAVEVIASFATVGNVARGAGVPAALVDALPKRMFDAMLAQYTDRLGVNNLLDLLGLLERLDFDLDPANPDGPSATLNTFHFERLIESVTNPLARLRAEYDWGVPAFDGSKLFAKLEKIIARTGMPVLLDAGPARLDVVFAELEARTDVSPPGLLIRIKNDIEPATQSVPLGDGKLDASFGVALAAGTTIALQTDGGLEIQPPTPTPLSGDINLSLTAQRLAPPDPFLIFGASGGSRLEFKALQLTAGTRVEWNAGRARGQLAVGAHVTGVHVLIDTSSGDGFLAMLLPAKRFEAEFDLTLGLSRERGLAFGGSSALEVRLPVHVPIGPLSIEALTLKAAIDAARIPISIGADIRAELGPIVAIVQNIGATATFSFPPGNGGNLGPLQLDIGFKWPTGVGLSVDAGPLRGGGALGFNPDKGEYFGALELSFEGLFSLKAVAIISTRMPDGKPGFALLILITAEFIPIQLGFGFTLVGVGGLLGLNHSLDTDALKVGVRTGAINSILFPQDVVANISRIVSDMIVIFPVAQDHFVVAPMGKLGWGTPTLITLELGVVIDIPSPQFAIIGVLRCVLPDEDLPLLRLQVNFAGGIDFSAGLIWFDASLFDSGLLIYTLSGDMAVRLGWGSGALLILTVGGFHPAFREAPPDLAGMRRLTIALFSGDNPRLTAQTYFAVTSNTVQTGSRVELYAEACGFNVYGFLGYDLLIQFDPFHFIADFGAGLALREGDDEIAGISVQGELSGPSPFHAIGSGHLKFLFIKITVGFDVTWGDDASGDVVQEVDVLKLVADAVGDSRNWHAELPANASGTVTMRKVEPQPGQLFLHPFGVLSVSQKVAPLDLPINKFGNNKPSGDTQFALKWAGGTADEVREEFAVANFVAMSDSDKLSRQSFERLKSGLRFGAGESATTGARLDKEVTYELSYLHKNSFFGRRFAHMFAGVFSVLSAGSAAASSALSTTRRSAVNGPALVDIRAEDYHVVTVDGLEPHAPGMIAATEAEAFALYEAAVRRDPTLRDTLQVVARSELSESVLA
jgi:Family of unknown function (DUF6603)